MDLVSTEINQGELKRLLCQRKYHEPSSKSKKMVKILACVFGLIMGFVNGLFGAGGGMLAVPVLTYLYGLNAKRAHATAILVILPLCMVSAVVYLTREGGDWQVYVPTIAGVVVGGVVGAYALKKCGNVVLQFVFYGVMLLAGLKMLF
ncbi:MAG: sulfite exporter TauE/SafE family protein [Clostridia bacterium]|nr:sulfite exporter TauE/SafE family protein [Clostridia bacterium]